MNPQLIILLATLGQQAIAAAVAMKQQSGMTDDQLRAEVATRDQATRDSIDAFLATLPPQL